MRTGRCLCGAVRYALSGGPFIVLECHCSMCRRESGAASLVYAGYRRTEVVMSGSLKYYRASAKARRGFCPSCGSPVSYEDDGQADVIWLTAGTHDDAGSLPSREYVYVSDKLSWVELAQNIPQWPGERGIN